jgi:glycyl-tRNA synthetase
MWDKTQRIQGLVEQIGSALGMSAEEQAIAAGAAALCKADLATGMVVEMTSLQGVMGKYYALESGEKPEVAEAIYEHYFPRFAGDAAPKAKAGLAVGIADRLDTLTGLFGVGLAPTGAKDPFAQRRAAIGLVQSLIAWNLDFDLLQGIAWAAERQPLSVNEQAQQETRDFIIERLRVLLLEDGNRHDVVDAILSAQGHNPAAAAQAVKELGALTARAGWQQTLEAFSRCVRITRDVRETHAVDEAQLVEDAENALSTALQRAESADRKPGSARDFLGAFTPVIPAVNRFFDEVLVMAEDENLKRNRLGLLQRIVKLADGVADFSKLEGF